MSRPSKFSQEVVNTICQRLMEGESLRRICADSDMPGMSTVLDWLESDKPEHVAFRGKYARAREIQADVYAAETIEIADTPEIGTKTISKATGTEIIEGDMVEHRRLRVLSRQWYAAKLNSKYSDRLKQEVSGPDGGPVKHDVNLSAAESYERLLGGQ